MDLRLQQAGMITNCWTFESDKRGDSSLGILTDRRAVAGLEIYTKIHCLRTLRH